MPRLWLLGGAAMLASVACSHTAPKVATPVASQPLPDVACAYAAPALRGVGLMAEVSSPPFATTLSEARVTIAFTVGDERWTPVTVMAAGLELSALADRVEFPVYSRAAITLGGVVVPSADTRLRVYTGGLDSTLVVGLGADRLSDDVVLPADGSATAILGCADVTLSPASFDARAEHGVKPDLSANAFQGSAPVLVSATPGGPPRLSLGAPGWGIETLETRGPWVRGWITANRDVNILGWVNAAAVDLQTGIGWGRSGGLPGAIRRPVRRAMPITICDDARRVSLHRPGQPAQPIGVIAKHAPFEMQPPDSPDAKERELRGDTVEWLDLAEGVTLTVAAAEVAKCRQE